MSNLGPRRACVTSASKRAVLLALISIAPGPGFAQDDSPGQASPPGASNPSIAASLPLFADAARLRSALAAKGVTFQLTYIGDALANVAGGLRRGGVYDGRLELDVDADLERLAGWRGGSAHVSADQIHDTAGLSGSFVGNLLTVSNIEALPSSRLYEAWLEQKLSDGKVAIRAGQLGADTEFFTSTYGALFINSTFGWPAITATDLPSGGPAYPLATPAVRLRLQPNDKLAVLIGLFDGNPAGPGPGDPQHLDRHGLNFRVTDPPLAIGEAQYSYALAEGLPGTAKLGAWAHFASFADLRFDTMGVSLASPASNGMPRQLSGDRGIYGSLDQMIYHLPGAGDDKGIGLFARFSASPSDRNLIDCYVDGGVNVVGLLPGRPDDSLGLAVAYAHISDRASALDRDADSFSGVAAPVRDYEAAVELTYQAQIAAGWSVQPDVQYIVHPGGRIADPRLPGDTAPIPNSVVVGIRSTIVY